MAIATIASLVSINRDPNASLADLKPSHVEAERKRQAEEEERAQHHD